MINFVREDWTLFRSLNTLSQKAGVPVSDIPKIVVKELVDNALDASESCEYGALDDGLNGFYVEDSGEGIPGTPEEIADLFSISRPLSSSKLLRLPTRGALGNGLRVVIGGVLASGGCLKLFTRGQGYELIPRKEDGGTDIEILGQSPLKEQGSKWYLESLYRLMKTSGVGRKWL